MKLWNFINGHKTIIGVILLQIIQIANIQAYLGDYFSIVQQVIVILTGAALVHRVKKGLKKKFSPSDN